MATFRTRDLGTYLMAHLVHTLFSSYQQPCREAVKHASQLAVDNQFLLGLGINGCRVPR